MAASPGPFAPSDAFLAIDVGGTDMKSALADAGGNLSDVRRMGTPKRPDNPGETVIEAAEELLASYRHDWPDLSIRAIGMVAPGLVDERSGVGLFSANLGWRDFYFAERLQSLTGLPATFGHDVGAAADAEVRLGAARGFGDVVVTIIGTGIAGAVYCDGVRVRGGGYAGELGHALVPGGGPCVCGADGCLETIGSAGAIARRYASLSGVPVAGAREVLLAAGHGDRHAQQVFDEAVDAIAFSSVQLAAILGTEAIVIGGGLAQAGEQLLVPLRQRIDQRLSFHRRPVVLAARMGQNAGLIGAALRARDLLEA